MELPTVEQLKISRLGDGQIPSPLAKGGEIFADDEARVLVPSELAQLEGRDGDPPTFEMAGPRRQIFFDPETLGCGILTCGGLCPGLNDVIRSLVLTLRWGYGVKRILGFRYGYNGLTRKPRAAPVELTREAVDHIHQEGGTVLGSSRGPQDVAEMVGVLVERDIRLLFTIGGDGTLRGAAAIADEVRRRGLDIAVVGIPKTIDNDLSWIERSFGFATAVEEASRAIAAAHTEARGAWNGVGLVKLMGRHSGFIAAHATLSNSDVNFCWVPEVPLRLDAFLAALAQRLEDRHHAVVVVAEGAGQDLLEEDADGTVRDASGNVQLGDIGPFLKAKIKRFFAERGQPMSIKYIDPSYIIRSLPANSIDSEYCLLLGQHAVHAGMSGRTGMMVGYWNQRFTHVPLRLAAGQRKQIDPDANVWQRVLGATGQPRSMARPAQEPS